MHGLFCASNQNLAACHFFLLLAINALAQSSLFSTTKNPLLTKQKVKPNGPQTAFKICYEGKCQCKEKVTNCFLSDRNGAVTFEISSHAERNKITFTCEGAPKDIDSLMHQIPHVFKFNAVYFKLKNCAQLPDILRRPNVTYEGNVEFSIDVMVPEGLFSRAKGLLTLSFKLTTSNVEKSLPPLLFHKLKDLTNLDLTIVSDVAEVTVPVGLLHELHGLQVLSLYVYHAESAYYEKLDAQRTAARNLSSTHFRDLRALRSLLLDGNYLHTLNGTTFVPLCKLNKLGLSLNGLEQLPEDLLASQSQLVILDLSMNLLSSLPLGIFNNTPLLWKLQLAENRFKMPTNIIDIVQPLRFLRQLDLSGNQLVQMWGTGSLRNRSLLTRTHISAPLEVPEFATYVSWERGAFNERQINLTSINLRKNRIAQFNFDWIAIGGLTCPYELNLLKNNIKHIYAAMQPLGTTGSCKQRLLLQLNPLYCDCRLAWVYSSNLLTLNNQWTCEAPSHLQGKLLNQLQRSDLCAWTPAFCPERCTCSYERMPALIVNCTGVQLEGISQLPRPEQFALTRTILYLERNYFYELPANTTFGYANVTHIYAARNRLTVILSSQIPLKLSVLDVRHNRLERLSEGFLRNYLNGSDTLKELYLSNNPWFCDCESELLLSTVRLHHSRIPDVNELRCANFANKSLLNITFSEVCTTPFRYTKVLAPLIVIFSISVLLLSFIALFYKYKLEVKIWLFGHEMFLCCINEHELDKDKTFDAFVSYAHQDQHYVNDVLLPGLEQGRSPFRICTHERNWLAGVFIPEQIIESVEQSRRTIIVLSQHFIESDWARMEFRTAHQCALNEGRARIIIIKYGELTNLERLDNELQVYLKLNTYLEWNDPRFWNKLRFAMPHKFGEGRKSGMLEVGRRINLTEGVEMDDLQQRM